MKKFATTTCRPVKLYLYFLRNCNQRWLNKKWSRLLLSELKFECVLLPLKKPTQLRLVRIFFPIWKKPFQCHPYQLMVQNCIWILMLNFKFVSCFPRKLFSQIYTHNCMTCPVYQETYQTFQKCTLQAEHVMKTKSSIFCRESRPQLYADPFNCSVCCRAWRETALINGNQGEKQELCYSFI